MPEHQPHTPHRSSARSAAVLAYLRGASLPDLVGATGIAQTTLHRWMVEARVIRTRSEGNRLKARARTRPRVYALVAQGLIDARIGARLGISPGTVKTHRARLRVME